MQRRAIIQNLLAIAAVSLTATFAHANDKQLKIGTMSGPDAQIWAVVTKVAAREGLNVKVVELRPQGPIRESERGARAGPQSAVGEEAGRRV